MVRSLHSVLRLFMANLVGEALCVSYGKACQLIPPSLSLHLFIIVLTAVIQITVVTLSHLNCGIH